MMMKAAPRADQTIFLTSGKWSPPDPGWWYQEGMNTPFPWNRLIPDHFVDVNKIVVPASYRPGSSPFPNCLGTAETIAPR